jgi:hypothetical protein
MSAHAPRRRRIGPIVAGGANCTSGSCKHHSGHEAWTPGLFLHPEALRDRHAGPAPRLIAEASAVLLFLSDEHVAADDAPRNARNTRAPRSASRRGSPCDASLATSTSLAKDRTGPAFVLAQVSADGGGVAAFVRERPPGPRSAPALDGCSAPRAAAGRRRTAEERLLLLRGTRSADRGCRHSSRTAGIRARRKSAEVPSTACKRSPSTTASGQAIAELLASSGRRLLRHGRRRVVA